MSTSEHNERWRALPSVRALIEDEALAAARSRYSHQALVEAARQAVARARERIVAGGTASVTATDVLAELARVSRPRLQRVINATGVILHTNLGRAPLAAEALAAIEEAAGYTNLELRLSTGARGGRDDGIEDHLRALTGAERAFAVNNCAAATLLALTAVARGREVIVSRGELVEIGGGFRVPEVLEQSGCRLVEVGTTNRTRADDYERAFTPNTAAILRVHRSNFALVGFTEDVPMSALAELAQRRGVPLLYDQGTGELDIVAEALRAGCGLVTFSGDKLLGGPQAGMIAGQAALVDAARKHPLARALRIDKLTLAALEATLSLRRSGQESAIPAARMLSEPAAAIRGRAERLGSLLGQTGTWQVVRSEATAGGGTRPGQTIESYAVSVRVERPHVLAALLRQGETPVVSRVGEGAVLLDLRTVPDSDLPPLARMTIEALRRYAEAEPEAHGASDPEGAELEAIPSAEVFKERE